MAAELECELRIIKTQNAAQELAADTDSRFISSHLHFALVRSINDRGIDQSQVFGIRYGGKLYMMPNL